MTTPSITHTALKVRQLSGHTWMAACSCGSYWDSDCKKTANRLRNKHIHQIAVEAKGRTEGAR